MAANVLTYVDAELAARDWGRTLNLPHVGGRVYLGLPSKPTFPAIDLLRVGGSPAGGDTPVDQASIQFDVWGDGRNKKQVAETQVALVGAINSLRSGTPMGTRAVAGGGSVESVTWSPDPKTDQARYVVTATFTLKAV